MILAFDRSRKVFSVAPGAAPVGCFRIIAYSDRYGRRNSCSIMASIDPLRCSTASTPSLIGICIPKRRAKAATAVAVSTPSTTERRPRSAASTACPRPSAWPSAKFLDWVALQVSTRSPSPDSPRKVSARAALRRTKPNHLGQAARDQRSSGVVAQAAPGDDPAGDRQHVLYGTADFGADRVL